ncbi:hypothetical protein ABZ816_26695 [Actinosynnema sp. NPDC047251]|uniref:hypothetical protein n=1 Tax=Saccharothrix espanaensis TaxID=103731 RepID=UPI0003032123|nr:hypothetical protein [Saccharothrix espanaensis]
MKVTLWVASCAVVLAGCASPAARQDASDTAARFLAAARDGDTAAACALLTPRTRDDLAFAEGRPCAEMLPADRLGGTVEDADTWSDEARVTTDQGAVYLTGFDSGWLVSAAGCRAGDDEPDQCAVG